MNRAWMVFLAVYEVYLIISAIRGILIGKGKIKHPMYDNIEKQKHILRVSTISLMVASVGAAVLLTIYLLVDIN